MFRLLISLLVIGCFTEVNSSNSILCCHRRQVDSKITEDAPTVRIIIGVSADKIIEQNIKNGAVEINRPEVDERNFRSWIYSGSNNPISIRLRTLTENPKPIDLISLTINGKEEVKVVNALLKSHNEVQIITTNLENPQNTNEETARLVNSRMYMPSKNFFTRFTKDQMQKIFVILSLENDRIIEDKDRRVMNDFIRQIGSIPEALIPWYINQITTTQISLAFAEQQDIGIYKTLTQAKLALPLKFSILIQYGFEKIGKLLNLA